MPCGPGQHRPASASLGHPRARPRLLHTPQLRKLCRTSLTYPRCGPDVATPFKIGQRFLAKALLCGHTRSRVESVLQLLALGPLRVHRLRKRFACERVERWRRRERGKRGERRPSGKREANMADEPAPRCLSPDGHSPPCVQSKVSGRARARLLAHPGYSGRRRASTRNVARRCGQIHAMKPDRGAYCSGKSIEVPRPDFAAIS